MEIPKTLPTLANVDKHSCRVCCSGSMHVVFLQPSLHEFPDYRKEMGNDKWTQRQAVGRTRNNRLPWNCCAIAIGRTICPSLYFGPAAAFLRPSNSGRQRNRKVSFHAHALIYFAVFYGWVITHSISPLLKVSLIVGRTPKDTILDIFLDEWYHLITHLHFQARQVTSHEITVTHLEILQLKCLAIKERVSVLLIPLI